MSESGYALQHDPETLSNYVRQIRRENRYTRAEPSQLPMVPPPANDSDETVSRGRKDTLRHGEEPPPPRSLKTLARA